MSNSYFEQYTSQVDAIKKANSQAISNIYEDINTIKIMCEAKQSKIFFTPNCILLFTVKHNVFYECWYFAEDIAALETVFNLFLTSYTETLPVRFMVVGKDEHTVNICNSLNAMGCTLQSKLARNLASIEESTIKMLQRDHKADTVEFAEPDDAQEIFDMINEEFDLYTDNIPELSQVKENIDKQHVVIIRKDNKIALLNYFILKNNIMYGYYDVVRKEFRDGQLYFSFLIFIFNYIRDNNIKRKYEWRNVTKKRLAKSPTVTVNAKATIYINFYVYKVKNSIGNI